MVHRRIGLAALSGVLFGLGLVLSGMTQPAKVLGFLDLTGHFDPSLAGVMAGAIAVHAVTRRLRRPAAERLTWEKELSHGRVDGPLLFGAALFGIGWGLAGICPGPALMALVVGPTMPLFLGPMLAGLHLGWRWRMAHQSRTARKACSGMNVHDRAAILVQHAVPTRGHVGIGPLKEPSGVLRS